jgi:cellulose synthase/poly-beta-1,6-N-acetylglucosamine synthase-like glycosyltransferase
MCLDAIVGGITAYGSLGWNHAVTCTGRNLFYRKKLFEEIRGFSGIDHILMGDDDLLMMKIRKQTDWKIRFMPDVNSAVLSDTPKRWRQFISQRSRHISASKYFPFSVKAGFGITFISKLFIMLFVFVLLLGNGTSHLNIALIIVLPYLATFFLLIMMSIKVRQVSNILFYPLWEIYYLFNQLMIGPLGFFGQITWGKK